MDKPARAASAVAHAEKVGAGRAPPATGAERRKAKRHPFNRDVQVVWSNPLAAARLAIVHRARDISTSGIGLIGPQMAHVGQRGLVCIPKADGPAARVGIEVLHAAYIGKMRYALGCRFIATPPDLTDFVFPDPGGAKR